MGPTGEIGPTGPAGIAGIQGERGPQGVQGPTGPRGDIGPQGVQGNPGPVGEQGIQGPTGPTGPAGTSIRILGSYDTIDDLTKEHPIGNVGDGYLIGDDLYVWSENDNTWNNVGRIRGPQGVQGEVGPAGVAGEMGSIGPTGPTGPRGDIGPQGINGIPGPMGPIGPQGERGIQGIEGEQGPTGPTGPTGPNGPEEIPSAYFVKFNSSIPVDGYQVASGARLPLDRKEVDNANQYILNLDENTIQFQKTGVYKVQFIVNAKMNATSQSFDINNDFISIGFRQVNDTIVYAGASTWDTNFDVIQLVGQGLFVVNQLTEKYELVNMSKYNLYLMGPKVENTITDSYYVNPLVTIIIEYLG